MCLIFDCCFSGSIIDGKLINLNQVSMMKFQKAFAKGLDKKGRVIMMSTMKRGTGVSTIIQYENNTQVIDFIRFFKEGIDQYSQIRHQKGTYPIRILLSKQVA